jgi:hypothetical protein
MVGSNLANELDAGTHRHIGGAYLISGFVQNTAVLLIAVKESVAVAVVVQLMNMAYFEPAFGFAISFIYFSYPGLQRMAAWVGYATFHDKVVSMAAIVRAAAS